MVSSSVSSKMPSETLAQPLIAIIFRTEPQVLSQRSRSYASGLGFLSRYDEWLDRLQRKIEVCAACCVKTRFDIAALFIR